MPSAAERIDATGKTLIPGLVDMHVYVMLCGEDLLFGFLGTGITTVRDLGSAPEVTLPMRDAIARGDRVGPRMVVHGPIMDGQPSIFGGRPGSSVATSEMGHLGRTWASEAITAEIDCLEHVHATC